mmetsp:Transcript_120290/g.347633  ORF Transcript_120290/g.347633 Transcript_120290/m.347633 type:complete len:217 (+) Transcript_120290:472-1122(+)
MSLSNAVRSAGCSTGVASNARELHERGLASTTLVSPMSLPFSLGSASSGCAASEGRRPSASSTGRPESHVERLRRKLSKRGLAAELCVQAGEPVVTDSLSWLMLVQLDSSSAEHLSACAGANHGRASISIADGRAYGSFNKHNRMKSWASSTRIKGQHPSSKTSRFTDSSSELKGYVPLPARKMRTPMAKTSTLCQYFFLYTSGAQYFRVPTGSVK